MDKQPTPPNPFANQGRPAFEDGGNRPKKIWAIVTTVGFGIFWVSLLYLIAELVGPLDIVIWPMILTPVGLAIGIFGRVMMSRKVEEAR
ncbi:hypothetical protein A8B78_14595 [Jannaschia sp. EhC01]|nr:hypothetical protein A8B78_14595 [Jannaschia sp. EhC01]